MRENTDQKTRNTDTFHTVSSSAVIYEDIHGYIYHFQLFTLLYLRQYCFLKCKFFQIGNSGEHFY